MILKEFLDEVRRGNIDIQDYTAKAIEETKKIDKEHN